MTELTTTRKELRKVFSDEIEKAIERFSQANPEQIFTIRETSEKLGKSYKTVWRMVKLGRLQTTADGKYITQKTISNYLTGKAS